MAPPTRVHVACLCATWCQLCGDYRAVLRAVAAAMAAEAAAKGQALSWHWIDIEDEAELVGDLEVETFPTLVIADPLAVRFAGPLAPQRDTLWRLLRASVLDAQPAWLPVLPEAVAFAARLQHRRADTL